MLGSVLDLLVPPRCVACGCRAELPWCRSCARRAAALAVREACPRCGADRAADRPHRCWRGRPPTAALHVGYRYRGVIAETVVTAKVAGVHAAWEPLGRLLAGHVPASAGEVATWVPTEPGRRRRRGVDHARELARGVAAGLGVPLVATLEARPGLPDQARRPEGHRARVPDGAFRPTGRPLPPRVLLIDDVVTTGATLSAAAAALRSAGATVSSAVLARAGRRHLGRTPHPPGGHRPDRPHGHYRGRSR